MGHHYVVILLFTWLAWSARRIAGQGYRDEETSAITTVNVGLVLSPENNNRSQSQLYSTISAQLVRINLDYISRGHRIELVTATIQDNPIEMSKIICEQLIGNPSGGVSAVIVDTDPRYIASIESISFTLALYNIPVIGTTLRDSSLFDKNLHSSHISLMPPYAHQADVWFNMMTELHFKRAIVLISSEKRDLLSRFVHLIDEQESDLDERINIETILEYDSGQFLDHQSAWEYFVSSVTNILESSISRVFLIHAQRESDVNFFLKLIKHFNMTSESFALVLSEEFVQVASARNLSVPTGSLWSQLSLSDKKLPNSIAYAMDALEIVTRAISDTIYNNQYNPPNLVDVPNSCKMNPSTDWHAGVELYVAILRQSFDGQTGYILFDENGDRLTASYDLLNTAESQVIQNIGTFQNGINMHVPSTLLNPKVSKIVVDVNKIHWPGGLQGQLISGLFINKHLHIITLQEKPFIWAMERKNCSSANISSIPGLISRPCKRININNQEEEDFCCMGYCIDLLEEIARRLNFSYDVQLVADNLYGSLEFKSHNINDELSRINESMQILAKDTARMHPESGELQLKWNGLMGELVSRRADMAFAPLTITPQRAQAIDFSKPFKFHGFSILLRKASKHTTLASFLQPFHNQLWVLVIGVATHVVALSLYLLDQYSTFGHFGIERGYVPKTPSSDNRPLHLSGSIWFSWSILLNSGVGEHTPRSLSGRVLGIFWSGFAMIVVASYTANLAAFLVLDTREETPTLSGIDDPRLRSGDLAFNFATVRGSAVDAYLQSQVEYINLYRKMEEFSFDNVDESILALRSGVIDALIWDSTRLEWEVASDALCSLGIAGESFGSSGYGIGLQKDSFWTKNVTTKLLELHESGFMIELDKKWITAGKGLQPGVLFKTLEGGVGHCDRHNEDFPETLGIFNILGVFILFACGLVTSLGLIVVERLCYKHRASLLKRQKSWWRRRTRSVPQKN